MVIVVSITGRKRRRPASTSAWSTGIPPRTPKTLASYDAASTTPPPTHGPLIAAIVSASMRSIDFSTITTS